ncbi:AAA family ATPase [Candidatus Poribacteria bacterium]|nr:AAA family ATPase [Candidatus Poribacteria bacterium]
MHLKRVNLYPEKYPTKEYYPFNLNIFQQTKSIEFSSPVTFFIGENGTGKSTLLEAISHRCGIHIWEDNERIRLEINPYEERLYEAIGVEWTNGSVPGSFFASQIFRNFAQILDEWAVADAGNLKYFGGKSLMTQSHGQSLVSFFKARYKIKGIYLMDEPETALSPKSQLELIKILKYMSQAGHAQFIIATHSPILMACPGAKIYSFDYIPVKPIEYEETEHYQIYKGFMENRDKYLDGI